MFEDNQQTLQQLQEQLQQEQRTKEDLEFEIKAFHQWDDGGASPEDDSWVYRLYDRWREQGKIVATLKQELQARELQAKNSVEQIRLLKTPLTSTQIHEVVHAATQERLPEKAQEQSTPKQTLEYGLFSCLPEDWRSNLETRLHRLKKAKKRPWIIRLKTLQYLLELLWAAIRITWDNIWLPKNQGVDK